MGGHTGEIPNGDIKEEVVKKKILCIRRTGAHASA